MNETCEGDGSVTQHCPKATKQTAREYQHPLMYRFIVFRGDLLSCIAILHAIYLSKIKRTSLLTFNLLKRPFLNPQ